MDNRPAPIDEEIEVLSDSQPITRLSRISIPASAYSSHSMVRSDTSQSWIMSPTSTAASPIMESAQESDYKTSYGMDKSFSSNSGRQSFGHTAYMMKQSDSSESWKSPQESMHKMPIGTQSGEVTPSLMGVPMLAGRFSTTSSQDEEQQAPRRSWSRMLFGSAESSRQYHLDGVRLIAALALLTSTVVTTGTAGWKGSEGILYPFRSNWGFAVFLTLIGRLFATPWLKPLGPPREGDTQGQASFLKLGQSLLARVFRFLLPVIVVSAAQYGTCKSSNGLYPDNEGFNTMIGGVDNKPQWCATNNKEWAAWTTSLFVEFDMSAHLQTNTSSLYASSWLLQASFYAAGVILFSHVFKTSWRTVLWVLLAFLNWTTYSYLAPVMLGILLADFSVSGQLSRMKHEPSRAIFKMGCINFSIALLAQFAALALFIVFTFVRVVRENVSDDLAKVQVLYGISGNDLTSGFELIRSSDVISAFLFILLAETVAPLRLALSFRPVSFVGRWLSAGLVLVSPLVMYGIVPRLFNPSTAGSMNGALASAWGYTFGISIALAILFLLLVELPSLYIGKAFVWFMLPTPRPVEAVVPTTTTISNEKREKDFAASPNGSDVALNGNGQQQTSWNSFPSSLLSKPAEMFRSLSIRTR